MFNPGPDESSLLSEIITTAMKKPHEKQLYVRGVLNQDPSTTKNPVVLFDGTTQLPSDLSVTLPAAIDVPTRWFVRELTKIAKGRAMVHSKAVVIDPFGKRPIVMTGSHNMGKKASGINDENLLIIENAPGLAAAYATNVTAVFNQYNWRYNTLHKVTGTTTYDGLKDHAFWQPWFWNFPELQPRRDAKFAEMDFWVGE
jgi:phosphatidylserine/phosphatidylglycerophosphate/cardiolipin synthase-like enzyme